MNSIITETANPRAGRRFQPSRELALHSPALKACMEVATSRREITIVKEMTGPYGIPDLTAIIGPKRLIDRRLSCTVSPLLNKIDAAVVAVSHAHSPRSTEAIAKSLNWPTETIARRVPHLLKSGGLIEVRSDRFVRPASIQPFDEIIAVEAKVEDWRKALRQVRTYAAWADSYVLVMGPLSEGVTERLSYQVEADSAGLVIDGKWMLKPTARPNPKPRRLRATEYAVAALRTR